MATRRWVNSAIVAFPAQVCHGFREMDVLAGGGHPANRAVASDVTPHLC